MSRGDVISMDPWVLHGIDQLYFVRLGLSPVSSECFDRGTYYYVNGKSYLTACPVPVKVSNIGLVKACRFPPLLIFPEGPKIASCCSDSNMTCATMHVIECR